MLPDYCLTTSGISLSGTPTAGVDSQWQGFGSPGEPGLNGRLAGSVSLSIALNGTVTANQSWTLAYWFDTFCNCPGPNCQICPRPELNDPRIDPNQEHTGSVTIGSDGGITVSYSFPGVSNSSWHFQF